MSWGDWIEPLMQPNVMDFAGIYGKNDHNPWAQKNDCLTTGDISTLQQIIKDGYKSPAFANGVTLSNKSVWAVLKVDEDGVILKGKGKEYIEWSLACVVSNQACVVGYCKSGGGNGARDVNNKIRGLVENLKATGY